MRRFSSPAETLGAVGEIFGPSTWLEITQDRVDAFADATGDRQWIHVDPVRAATGPFGGTVAHGYLALAVLPLLAADVVAYDGCTVRINYGVDRVRFPRPLRVGSRVRASAELAAARATDAGVRLTLRWRLDVEGQDKPACVADTLVLLIP